MPTSIRPALPHTHTLSLFVFVARRAEYAATFRWTSTVRRAQLEIHGGKKRKSVAGVSETERICCLQGEKNARVYVGAYVYVLAYARCHGNRSSKQACAFFNSNALAGKQWGYNEVPAYPSAIPHARIAFVFRNAAARCLSVLYLRVCQCTGRGSMPYEEATLFLCRYFSVDVQNFYKSPQECNKRARPASH